MLWRLINDKPQNAFFNMALDEAISEAVRGKISPPTLRLYQWEKPSITLGYFQKKSDINLDYCMEKSYPVVRRVTGGMAILHNFDLTYSFSACNDSEPFTKSLIKNYFSIGTALVSALRYLNINAKMALSKNERERNPYCFNSSSYGEIAVNGAKIIGSAQKRYNDGFLQQGSIMMDYDLAEVRKVFMNTDNKENPYTHPLLKNPPLPPFVKGGVGGFVDGIGTIRKYAPEVSVDKLKQALMKSFEQTFDINLLPGLPTECELTLAKKLECEKYSTEEWNFSR